MSYAQFIYHNLNEIKWILTKVFGTFRDMVISSLIKPRPFWIFWCFFFYLYIKIRRLVILNKSNKRKKNYTQTLQDAFIIKWLNIHTIHLKINSSFLSSESNGSYWNKNEQKKNTRTMHEHYELICIKFQEHKIICIYGRNKNYYESFVKNSIRKLTSKSIA